MNFIKSLLNHTVFSSAVVVTSTVMIGVNRITEYAGVFNFQYLGLSSKSAVQTNMR